MIFKIDHLVLTVHSLDKTCDFYVRVLGCVRQDVLGKPTALHFGAYKLNVHQTDRTFEPKASRPTPGSADFCLITALSPSQTLDHLRKQNVTVEIGPITREGAEGSMVSIYFRDPDSNLIEVSQYLNQSVS